MAQVSDLLARKGNFVLCISPTTTVLDAVQLMNRHKVGSACVCIDDRIIGIFTERDVLTRVVGEKRDPVDCLVEDVMTSDIAYARMNTEVDQVAAIMKVRRIRHLPVCDDHGRLQGLVSIGDVNAFRTDGQATEIHYLQEYIHGRV